MAYGFGNPILVINFTLFLISVYRTACQEQAYVSASVNMVYQIETGVTSGREHSANSEFFFFCFRQWQAQQCSGGKGLHVFRWHGKIITSLNYIKCLSKSNKLHQMPVKVKQTTSNACQNHCKVTLKQVSR